MPRSVVLNLLTGVFKVQYFRPDSLFLDRFERDPASCNSCEPEASGKLKLVLDVRANGNANTATKPPASLDHYRKVLQQVFDRYKGRVAVLVVEKEEDDARLFWAGSASEYLKLLKAACEVSHSNHVPCTDGGMSSRAITALVVDHDMANDQQTEAMGYIQRLSGAGMPTLKEVQEFTARKAELTAVATSMLAGFKAAGVDYINFHWQEKDRLALHATIRFLKAAGGGLPVMSDSMGQRNDDEAETLSKLEAVREEALPFVVWFSADDEGARSLVNPDGSLRATGKAFQATSATLK